MNRQILIQIYFVQMQETEIDDSSNIKCKEV